MIREAVQSDLQEILALYLYLHEMSIPNDSEHLRQTWEQIIHDENHRKCDDAWGLSPKRICYCVFGLRKADCKT